ncbi:hypothetical protein OIU76_007003 [Salix suchowensis]|nr:hypothetical protein OIU76_007003 [Salix suchowensis]
MIYAVLYLQGKYCVCCDENLCVICDFLFVFCFQPCMTCNDT